MVRLEKFSWNQKFQWDLIIAIVIAIIPFTIYFHLLFDQTDHDVIEFIGLTYHHGFADTSTFIWSILIRIIPLVLYIIWFLVNPYWWHYFILAPITMNIYSLGKDCFYFPYAIQRNEDLFLLCVILIFGTLLIICHRLILLKYRLKNINDLAGISTNQRTLYQLIKEQLLKIKSDKEVVGVLKYSVQYYYLKELLNNRFIEHFEYTSAKQLKYTRKREIGIIFYLILISSLPYLIKLMPEEQSTIDFLWITIDDNGFNGLTNYIWFLSVKLSILGGLIIWFYTSKNWWRYAILSPIILYTYQFWEANQDVTQLDALGNLNALPAIFTVVILLIIISNTFKYRYGLLDMYEEIESELDKLIDNAAKKQLSKYREIRDLVYHSNIPRTRNLNRYLEKLNDLKDQIQYKLRTN